MSSQPKNPPLFSADYRLQEARASAALPAAGAFDASPTEMVCADMEFVALYVTYTRAAAGGAVTFKIETSPRTTDSLTLENWYQATILAGGAVVGGADTTSLLQRDETQYTSTGAGAETFVLPIALRSTAERLRVACAESGVVGNPGTVQITAVFS